MPHWDATSREVAGEIIPGTFLRAFIHNDFYYLTEIKIYKDGMIDCWDLVTFEEFKNKVAEGWIVTTLPEGARVSTTPGIYFTASDVKSIIEEQEFIKQVADEIKELNGEPTSLQICQEALLHYKKENSEEAKNELRKCYLAVPKHMRRFLGDMGSKDSEYRSILNI
jgi:hypothetical protein